MRQHLTEHRELMQAGIALMDIAAEAIHMMTVHPGLAPLEKQKCIVCALETHNQLLELVCQGIALSAMATCAGPSLCLTAAFQRSAASKNLEALRDSVKPLTMEVKKIRVALALSLQMEVACG